MILTLLLSVTGAGAVPAQERSFDFWRALPEAGYAVPEGESAAGLLGELDQLLSSRDSTLRDDLGYGIPSQWVRRQRLLAPEELRDLTRTWSSWLGRGLGERETDSVLLRSFAALDLSILASHDLEAPFLDEAGFAALLDAALDYLAQERDLRGWVEGVGWVHATAHTADLLKFLVRNPRLDADGQARVLEGLALRMADTGGTIFVHDEDDRLAACVISLMARDDFEAQAFADFLELAQAPARAAPAGGEFDPEVYAAQRNTHNLLGAVHERLSLVRELPERLLDSRAALVETLRSVRGL